MKTRVFIDGLNLYYGALKGTPYKWLNPARLCELLLPRFQITHTEYFTALVRSRPERPDQRVRQQTYLRALRTLPSMEIVLARFLTSEVNMPVAQQRSSPTRFVRVVKTEEKDQIEPTRIVRDELRLPVGILNPHKRALDRLLRLGCLEMTLCHTPRRKNQPRTRERTIHSRWVRPSAFRERAETNQAACRTARHDSL
jgi:hypothetical protein